MPRRTWRKTLDERELAALARMSAGSKRQVSSPVRTFADPRITQRRGDGCIPGEFTWFEPGVLGVWSGTDLWYPPYDLTLVTARASVPTAPTGASIKVDVNKNGTTVFTDQSHRPTIAISGNTALDGGIDVVDVAIGDYLSFDIDQVGSTIHGSDLAVTLGYLICTRPSAPAVATPSLYRSLILADGPVAYWRLGEASGTSAADETGNGHTGTYHGAATLGQSGLIAGDPTTSVLLSYTSPGWISAPANAAFDLTGDFTLECWIKAVYAGGDSYPMLITKSVGDGSVTNNFEWRGDIGSHVRFIQKTASGWQAVDSSYIWTGDVTYLAVRKVGTTITHWRNGVANGTGTISATGVSTTSTDVLLGARDDGAYNWSGYMQEAAIYNYGLSDAQLLSHYNAGI